MTRAFERRQRATAAAMTSSESGLRSNSPTPEARARSSSAAVDVAAHHDHRNVEPLRADRGDQLAAGQLRHLLVREHQVDASTARRGRPAARFALEVNARGSVAELGEPLHRKLDEQRLVVDDQDRPRRVRGASPATPGTRDRPLQ